MSVYVCKLYTMCVFLAQITCFQCDYSTFKIDSGTIIYAGDDTCSGDWTSDYASSAKTCSDNWCYVSENVRMFCKHMSHLPKHARKHTHTLIYMLMRARERAHTQCASREFNDILLNNFTCPFLNE